jgi:hypothetical protein
VSISYDGGKPWQRNSSRGVSIRIPMSASTHSCSPTRISTTCTSPTRSFVVKRAERLVDRPRDAGAEVLHEERARLDRAIDVPRVQRRRVAQRDAHLGVVRPAGGLRRQRLPQVLRGVLVVPRPPRSFTRCDVTSALLSFRRQRVDRRRQRLAGRLVPGVVLGEERRDERALAAFAVIVL